MKTNHTHILQTGLLYVPTVIIHCCSLVDAGYLSNGATSVDGKTEDHLVWGNLRSAVLIVQVQAVAVIPQRVQVGPLNHNVHVV